MISSRITIKELKHRKESNEIIANFIYFLDDTIDENNYSNIKNNKRFANLFGMINEYGNAIFQDLVNVVANIQKISIKRLLENYFEYTNN